MQPSQWPAAAPAPTIRPPRPGERAAIRHLLELAYAEYVDRLSPDAWTRYLADLLDLDRHAGHGELLVADVGGDVAAYGAFYPDATDQGVGWPAGWASGRGLAVHPRHRGRGVAAMFLAYIERRARASGAPVFAFHTAHFMTGAQALYERLGYRRLPAFDRDLNTHYGIAAGMPWTALAYGRDLRASGERSHPPRFRRPA